MLKPEQIKKLKGLMPRKAAAESADPMLEIPAGDEESSEMPMDAAEETPEGEVAAHGSEELLKAIPDEDLLAELKKRGL